MRITRGMQCACYARITPEIRNEISFLLLVTAPISTKKMKPTQRNQKAPPLEKTKRVAATLKMLTVYAVDCTPVELKTTRFNYNGINAVPSLLQFLRYNVVI